MAKGFCISDPIPFEVAAGSNPNDPIKAIITTGLILLYTPSEIASFKPKPSWQWWDLCKSSKSIKIDGTNIKPIVRVIDNFVTNHSLTNLFEAKVGNGYLIFSTIDLKTNIEKRPAAKQLKIVYWNT